MVMNKADWYGYAAYLKDQVKNVNLQVPKSIGEAYNSFQVMQDLADVMKNKLGVKPKNVEKKA